MVVAAVTDAIPESGVVACFGPSSLYHLAAFSGPITTQSWRREPKLMESEIPVSCL